jgi:FkbM family methyltransferase
MMIARKIGKLYPLLKVLKLMKIAKPLGAKQALSFYTAPLKWIAHLGRVKYSETLPSLLTLINSPYGTFCTHLSNVLFLVHENYEIEHFLPNLINRDTVFVDVGAYMGLYTVYACRRARRVLAVEPNPMALAYLKTNVALNNCNNTIVIPKAVSDRRRVVKLRIPRPARRGQIPTTASIVWSFEEALEIDVETDTLDNIVDEAGLDTVDFVKIDVEGAEGLVVKGAERTLRKARALLIEIWPENTWIISYLQALGYKLMTVISLDIYKSYNCLFFK